MNASGSSTVNSTVTSTGSSAGNTAEPKRRVGELPMRRTLGALALVLVLGVGCSTVRVSTDFDRGIAFTEFESYAWLPSGPSPSSNPRLNNDLVDARIRRAVDQGLASRGFRLVPEAQADFLITYFLGLESRIDVQTVHSRYRYSRVGWSGGVATDTRVRQYEEGTLMLDVLDAEGRRLVWRGTAQARVSRTSNNDRRERRITKAVEQILNRFPPG